MAHEVFITYPSVETRAADAVVSALEGRGIRCWIAPRDVRPGDEWASSIVGAIERSKLMVLVFSSEANKTPHVLREVELAVQHGLPVLPVRIEDVEPSPALEYLIGGSHWLDIFADPIDEHLDPLIHTAGAVIDQLRADLLRVVVSCPRADARVADAVVSELEDASMQCWYAPRDLDPETRDVSTSINEAIDVSEVMVVVLSEHTSRSHQIASEVQHAVDSDTRIVCVRTGDVEPRGAVAIAYPAKGTVSRTWWSTVLAAPSVDATATMLGDSLTKLVDLIRSEPDKPSADARQDSAGSSDFDVFISYRRTDGAHIARLMQVELRERGVKAFLDVDDLRPGQFDDALLAEIEQTPAFLLILSPQCLDRCSAEDDWLRREIAHALAVDRTILPLLMPGFEFPSAEELPAEIRPILVHHGVPFSHEFFEAVVNKIVGYLQTPNTLG